MKFSAKGTGRVGKLLHDYRLDVRASLKYAIVDPNRTRRIQVTLDLLAHRHGKPAVTKHLNTLVRILQRAWMDEYEHSGETHWTA